MTTKPDTLDRAALMHRLTYHAAGLSDRALRLLVLMAELSAAREAPHSEGEKRKG